jgi:hypothetical protein
MLPDGLVNAAAAAKARAAACVTEADSDAEDDGADFCNTAFFPPAFFSRSLRDSTRTQSVESSTSYLLARWCLQTKNNIQTKQI